MEDDQVISAIGPWGPWQRFFVLIVGATTMLSSWPSLIIKFTAAPTDHWCARPHHLAHLGVEEWRRLSSPEVTEGGKSIRDRCHVWEEFAIGSDDPVAVAVAGDDVEVAVRAVAQAVVDADADADDGGGGGAEQGPNLNRSLVPCQTWEHDRSEFVLTAGQEWDLVCGRESYQNLAQSAFFVGMLLGTMSIGILSDRYGRRQALIPCIALTVVVGVILPLSPTVHVYIGLKFIQGMVKIGIFVISFIWCMEVVGGAWHTYVGIGMQFPWVVAWLSLCAMAWLLKGHWHALQWATSAPGIVALGLWWVLPESPRWLLTVGRLDEAEEIIRKAADKNGRKLEDTWKLQSLNLNNNRLHEKKGNLCDLFRKRNLAAWTIVIFFNWFANSFVYYGLTLNTGDLGGSYQLNFLLNGVFEIPAYFITLYVLMKGGRRVPYVSLLVLGALSLLATTMVEADRYPGNWPIVALAMFGKFCITGTFSIIYVYSAEVFPTVVRSIGVGTSSVFARIGGAIAPYVGSMGKTFNPTVPIAVFGLTALLAGATALALPETRDLKLPDTLEEGNKTKSEEPNTLKQSGKEEGEDEEEEEKLKMTV